jgi:hypothetical protein
MVKIFFFSPNPAAHTPMKDPVLRSMLHQSHGWDASTGVYGVAIPRFGVDPSEVCDYLRNLGVVVLPGVHDTTTDANDTVVTSLSQHGVVKGDKAHAIAQKMYTASGMPILKPHLY